LFAPSPLQLYVHIPFCLHKCHYCDFNSHERLQPDWDAYRNALIAELKHWSNTPQFSDRNLHSIFFGGGTPSLAPPALIGAIIDTARDCCGIENNAEITLEANPGTADSGNFRAYRQAGINRLSIGIQSLDAEELQWLERVHGPDEAVQAYHIGRDAGFSNINLDLMYGLPGQSLHEWLTTLHSAIKLCPEHLSCYQLTIEPHTRLAAAHAQKPYLLPDDEMALSMFFDTRKYLSYAGYDAYEISNFSRPGLQCRHNDGYWLYHDYIGIGAGASGKWDIPNGEPAMGMTRYSNLRSPESYIRAVEQHGVATNTKDILNCQQAAAEACWLGLRRKSGINRAEFKQRFGFDIWQHFHTSLQPWHSRKKLAVTETSVYITTKGLAVTDEIASSVL